MVMVRYAWTMFLLQLKKTSFFRLSFLVRVLSEVSNLLFYYTFFELIFKNVTSIGDWGKGEVFMLIGTMGMISSISRVFFGRGAPSISSKVRYGYLDILFTKPVPGALLLTISQPAIHSLIGIIFPLYLFIYGLRLSGVLAPLGIFVYIVAFSLSLSVYNLFHTFIGLFPLRAVQLSGAFWLIEDLFNFSRYPYKIFPFALRMFFLTFIPVLAISNLPVLALIEGPIFLLPLAGLFVLFSLLVYITYPIMRRMYKGAGTAL